MRKKISKTRQRTSRSSDQHLIIGCQIGGTPALCHQVDGIGGTRGEDDPRSRFPRKSGMFFKTNMLKWGKKEVLFKQSYHSHSWVTSSDKYLMIFASFRFPLQFFQLVAKELLRTLGSNQLGHTTSGMLKGLQRNGNSTLDFKELMPSEISIYSENLARKSLIRLKTPKPKDLQMWHTVPPWHAPQGHKLHGVHWPSAPYGQTELQSGATATWNSV